MVHPRTSPGDGWLELAGTFRLRWLIEEHSGGLFGCRFGRQSSGGEWHGGEGGYNEGLQAEGTYHEYGFDQMAR